MWTKFYQWQHPLAAVCSWSKKKHTILLTLEKTKCIQRDFIIVLWARHFFVYKINNIKSSLHSTKHLLHIFHLRKYSKIWTLTGRKTVQYDLTVLFSYIYSYSFILLNIFTIYHIAKSLLYQSTPTFDLLKWRIHQQRKTLLLTWIIIWFTVKIKQVKQENIPHSLPKNFINKCVSTYISQVFYIIKIFFTATVG